MKLEQAECSETSAYEVQTPGNYPEENIQHTEHGESSKSSGNVLQVVYCTVSEKIIVSVFKIVVVCYEDRGR